MDLNKLSSRRFGINYKTDEVPDNLYKSIAVIGINAQIGEAKNIEEFWEYLSKSSDMVRDFPSERFNDADKLNQTWFHTKLPEQPVQAAYMNTIDKFDAELHNISPIEAELMDPTQRIFLEAAWSAVEDAGYSTQSLRGENVGVYIGSGSSDNPYHAALWNADTETFGIAVSGNVDSMMAGRVSYLMNLKGPAVVIDSACSSSLVAVNFACQQLRNGEISMALVGGVKLIMLPPDEKYKIGVEASSGRTKTLDEKADGTGRGEGVVCMLLKPYLQAKADKDHIYAVIRGGAVNQDGASVGITAPNPGAQEMVIKTAWQDAQVDPETISFIEMHGTATKLGDTAEITGIEQAFGHFTKNKQFCAVGSVKSNVGHLDGAAGIAGLLKAILMLNKKQLLPTIHFNSPNRKIDLISSPVYVNDKVMSWKPACGIRRCGVSSFGLSGTNCHIVLEEAIDDRKEPVKHPSAYIITASAKNKDRLIELLKSYQIFLKKYPNCDPNQFCYTVNTGRGQYRWRFAMVVESVSEFINSDIENIISQSNICLLKEHKVSAEKSENAITHNEKNEMSQDVNDLLKKSVGVHDLKAYIKILKNAAEFYVAGADTDWKLMYGKECPGRISIPSYPFSRTRYWHNFFKDADEQYNGNVLHPLIDECSLKMDKLQVYTKKLSLKNCWELKEHIINGVHVLPGTAIIEMIREALTQYTKNANVEMYQLTYLTPITFEKDDPSRIINIVLSEDDDKIFVEIRSKNPKTMEWESHARVKGAAVKYHEKYNKVPIEDIINRCNKLSDIEPLNHSIVRINGEHWDNADYLYSNDNEILIHFNMNEKIRHELQNYYLHPGMLDPAINAGSYLTKGIFLPFSFKTACFKNRLPSSFYSWIRQNKLFDNSDGEIATFDINLCDESGNIIGRIDEYVLKNVRDANTYLNKSKNTDSMYSEIRWVRNDRNDDKKNIDYEENGIVIAFLQKGQEQSEQFLQLKRSFHGRVVTVLSGTSYTKQSDNLYTLGDNFNDYEELLEELHPALIQRIIHMSSYRIKDGSPYTQLEDDLVQLKSVFYIVKALFTTRCEHKIHFNLLTNYASAVINEQNIVYPGNRALIGFCQCIGFEYGNVITHAIDFDVDTPFHEIVKEMQSESSQHLVAYRKGVRYTESLVKIYGLKHTKEIPILRENGTYIIAGGFGGVGIALAKQMFSMMPNIHIILMSRNYSDEDLDNPFLDLKKMQEANKMRESNYDLHIEKVDITKAKEVKTAIEDIIKDYGDINGIINAAGIAGEGFILNKEWEKFYKVLAPKIIGNATLHEYTQKCDLDFFVMCSSCASVFGAAGQSDYVAANAYLDAFADYRKTLGLPVLGINWTGWSESGMAANHKVRESNSYTYFVTDEEGTKSFAEMLESDRTRIIVGRLNYEIVNKEKGVLEHIISLPFDKNQSYNSSNDVADSEANYDISEIIIDGIEKDQINDIEKMVIYAWAHSLGTNKVDVNEKFFDSGGNSLLVAVLHKELDKLFPEQVSITEIFVYSTITEMAKHIRGKATGLSKENFIEDIKEQVDIESLVSRFANGELELDEITMLL